MRIDSFFTTDGKITDFVELCEKLGIPEAATDWDQSAWPDRISSLSLEEQYKFPRLYQEADGLTMYVGRFADRADLHLQWTKTHGWIQSFL